MENKLESKTAKGLTGQEVIDWIISNNAQNLSFILESGDGLGDISNIGIEDYNGEKVIWINEGYF